MLCNLLSVDVYLPAIGEGFASLRLLLGKAGLAVWITRLVPK